MTHYVRQKAKYNGRCECGRLLLKGEWIRVERTSRHHLCVSCYKKLKKGDQSVPVASHRAEEIIAKIDRLDDFMLPGGKDLRDALVDELRRDHAREIAARNFLGRHLGFCEEDREWRVISAKFGQCCDCGEECQTGTAVLFNAVSRRVWCFACAEKLDGSF